MPAAYFVHGISLPTGQAFRTRAIQGGYALQRRVVDMWIAKIGDRRRQAAGAAHGSVFRLEVEGVLDVLGDACLPVINV